MDYIGHGWGMGFGMWFTLLLFMFIIFYFLKETSKEDKRQSTAQDILDKRYANGEIGKEEYEEKCHALKKNN